MEAGRIAARARGRLAGILLAVVAAVVWFSAASRAAAQPGATAQADAEADAEARRLFEEGVAALDREAYATAMVAFLRAYELRPRPLLLYNIGMCARALGRFSDAIRAFQQYLRETGPDVSEELRQQVELALTEMSASLGRVRIQVNRDGASVLVDGVSEGFSPLPYVVALQPGQHALEVSRDDCAVFRDTFEVRAGETIDVGASLVPGGASDGECLAGPDVEAVVAEPVWWTAEEERPAAATTDEPGYFSDWRNITGWTLAGTGVIFMGLWINSWIEVDAINSDPQMVYYRSVVPRGLDACDYARTMDPARPDYIADLCDAGETWWAVSYASLPLWIVLWGTAAGLLIWYGTDDGTADDGASASAGPQLALSPSLGPTGGGLGITGWF